MFCQRKKIFEEKDLIHTVSYILKTAVFHKAGLPAADCRRANDGWPFYKKLDARKPTIVRTGVGPESQGIEI